MNNSEAVMLVRMVRALCSGQKLDEFSPDAWAVVLDDIRFADAQQAVKSLGKRQHFIDPADIRTEVARIRKDRADRADDPIPPPDLTPQQTIDWYREAWRRIGDGEVLVQPRGELKVRGPLPVLGRRMGDAA